METAGDRRTNENEEKDLRPEGACGEVARKSGLGEKGMGTTRECVMTRRVNKKQRIKDRHGSKKRAERK